MTRLRRLAAVALASTLVLGACGGGDDNKADLADKDSTSTSSDASTDSTSVEGSVTTVPGAASATTRKSGVTATTSGVPARKPTPGVPDVVAVAPGNYKYTVTGTSNAKGTVNGVPLNTSKKADRAFDVTYQRPEGNTQKANYAGQTVTLEQVLSYSGQSADFTYLRINNAGNETTFTPNPPTRFVPMPGAVGATWAWTMTSKPDPQDGKVTTRKADFRIDRVETIQIAGAAVQVFVIIGNMTTDQPILKTHKLTTYYSEALKLVVKEREITDSDVEQKSDKGETKIHIHTDATTTISSLSPS